MVQRFIEIGEGYSDLYELIEIANTNKHRIDKLICLQTVKDEKKMCSFVVTLHPASPGHVYPLYICREGIPQFSWKETRRYTLFTSLAAILQKEIFTIDVRHSSSFQEKDLYYSYIIGVLRMNRIIPPLQ
ncbi:DUF7147 family protein [Alkalihalobacterium bogoriense]|uniref:DUF7147 family protein n=1 Tax=Alkalihalobacterium bogoriense TaxID=246272 RepID=UPI0004786959|nr:hypothetical protein [Alkalihalobacterium bogoriense]